MEETRDYSNLGSLFASPWYLRIDDNLRITSYNALTGVVLEVRHRMVDCEGEIQASVERQVPNTDRTAKSSIIATPEGWLLGGEVFVSGAAPLTGQTFVVVEIVRGLVAASALALEVIAAGYVTAKQPLRFPGPGASSLDGAGALRAIAGTTPAATSEISETVPTGARWELLAFYATLTTSVGVATRAPTLRVTDGTGVLFDATDATGFPASTAGRLSWFQGGVGQAGASGNSIHSQPLPTNNRLGAGFVITTSTFAIQAGDQYGSVRYLVREWLEGA